MSNINVATETTRPTQISPEVWEQLNKNQQRTAFDANRANGFKGELEKFLFELAVMPEGERAERLTLKLNGLATEQDKRRFFHSFLVGGIADPDAEDEDNRAPIAKSKTNATKFKEALESFIGEHFQSDGTIKGSLTDDETGEAYLFDALPMPRPIEKTAKENELTTYLKGVQLKRAEYTEALQTLAKNDLENIFSLMVGLLNFIFVQLSISFPDKSQALPKNAKEFILHLISVKPANTTEFRMLDAELMAKTGIRSKTTLIGMRNALIDWQDKIGLGLVDIQKKADQGESNDPAQSKGIKYNLLILDILATKAMSFIENGISVADAQIAVSAITKGDENQIKLLPADVKEAAESIAEETALEVESLPPVSVEITAQAQALKDAFTQKAQEKAAKEQEAADKRRAELSDSLNAIAEYRATPADQRTPEQFEAYIAGRMAEMRHDQTNLLTEDEAKGKLETVLNRLESDIVLALCLMERLPKDDAKAQQAYVIKLAQNVQKASKV